MTASSNVVVGFDFSRGGRAALQRAIDLVAQTPIHILHFVCVIDPRRPIPAVPTTTGVDYQYAERVQQAVTGEVEARLRETTTDSRVSFCVHARIGHPADEILAVARDIGADLIIVGSKPITMLEHLVLGSVSAKVARDAGCTVEIARAKSYRSVELATMVEVTPHHSYVPPHRYTYDARCPNARSSDWPLY